METRVGEKVEVNEMQLICTDAPHVEKELWRHEKHLERMLSKRLLSILGDRAQTSSTNSQQ